MNLKNINKDSPFIRPFLTLLLFISFMLAGCSTDEVADGIKEELEIDSKEQVQEEPIEEFSPELTLEDEIKDNELLITGKTNLPDETVLLVTLLNNNSAEIEKSLTVKNGEFFADAIPIEELKSGEQSIKVSIADDQPDAVLEVIGENRELLVGELIDSEQQLTVAAKVEVPSERAPPSDVKGYKTTVTRVVDGDTIKAMIDGKEESVRLILVDTPETKHPQMGVQPFGPEASAFTTEQLEGKEVTLEVGVQERDRYGRVLAYVWLGDKLFNQTLLEKGLARVAVYPPNTKYLDEFEATQANAKKKAIGIWSIENYATDNGFKEKQEKKTVATNKATTNNTQKAGTITTQTKAAEKPKTEPKQEQKVQSQPKQEQKAESKPEPKGACNIKGSKSGIYHVPGSTYYDRTTNPVAMFCSVEEAQKAGYRAPKR